MEVKIIINIKLVSQAITPNSPMLEKIARHVPGVLYQFRMRPDGTSHFPYVSEAIRGN
jgi:hypothetical protein